MVDVSSAGRGLARVVILCSMLLSSSSQSASTCEGADFLGRDDDAEGWKDPGRVEAVWWGVDIGKDLLAGCRRILPDNE